MGIRIQRPIKYHQTVVKQQPNTAINVTKSSDIWLIPRYYEIVQNIRPLNKPGPQDIVSIWRKE